MQRLQLRQQRREVAVARVRHGRDAGPWQRVVVGALAVLAGIHRRRERHVRYHALVLGRTAADAEELRDGQLDLAEARFFIRRPAVEVDQVLHRALAERGLADDEAAAVVLDRAGEDLRGRGRAAVDQHRQRALPRDARVVVAVDHHPATGFAHLHHRAAVDEQAGELDRLVQRAAAVVAQVQHHAIDLVGAQPGQQLADVAGGGGIVVLVQAPAFEVLVEARQLDHADTLGRGPVVGGDGDDFRLRRLVFQADLVAHQHHAVGLAVQAGLGRDHVQADLGALGAADLGDDVVDAPADHVFHRAAVALADADHAIAGLELARHTGRTAGHDLADRDHVVLFLQLRADAFQRQRHRHVERLGRARGEVIGVRVDRIGVAVDEGLEHILALPLGDALGEVGVALVERLADLVGLLAGQLQAQPVVARRLLPQRIQRGLVGRPRRVLAVVVETIVAGEGEQVLLEQAARMRHAGVDALTVGGEDRVRRPQVAAFDRVVELGLVPIEAGDVLRGEVLLARVQRLQVARVHVGRQRVVERARAVGVAAVGKQPVDQLGRGALVGRRRGRQRIDDAVVDAREQRQRRGQQEGKQGGLNFHRGGFAARVGLIFQKDRTVGAVRGVPATTGADRAAATWTTAQCRKLPRVSLRNVIYTDTHNTGLCGRRHALPREDSTNGSVFDGWGRAPNRTVRVESARGPPIRFYADATTTPASIADRSAW